MRSRVFGALGAERTVRDGPSALSTRPPSPHVGLLSARARAATLLRGALLAGVSLATLAPAAHAVDGIWTGPGAEWTDGTNWSSTPDVPDDTAAFTNNGAPTSVTISSAADIITIQFTAAAPAYSFINSDTFNINGVGIVNNSAFAPTFTN